MSKAWKKIESTDDLLAHFATAAADQMKKLGAMLGKEMGVHVDCTMVGRHIVLKAGGKVRTFHIPGAPVARGAYVLGTFYERGDIVVREGKAWNCERNTTAEPGDGPDWSPILDDDSKAEVQRPS
jgi:hypothetical protein